MKALISPNEAAYSYDGLTILGMRIAQVAEEEFPVASPLFWWDCSVDCTADNYYYIDGQCLPKPPLPPEQDPAANTP